MCVFHIRYLATRLAKKRAAQLPGTLKTKENKKGVSFYFSASGFVMCYRFLGRRRRSANWGQTSSSSNSTYVHKRFRCAIRVEGWSGVGHL